MLYPLSYGGRSHRVAVTLAVGGEFGIWQAGGVDEAERAITAIESQDWDRLRMLLHPYLHWTAADGNTIRGRTKVLAMLAATPDAVHRPSSVELRDGQIYRWRI